jgi:lysine-N-methylase
MSLPLRTLPVVEHWDCHGCGICCRATIIPLSDDDAARIREQHWEDHPDYRGRRILVRTGWWRGKYRLARRPDGNCIFWTEAGLCRIHQEHGLRAKPLVCQMFPLQLVPVGDWAYLTVRRNCPSAAADSGRPLDEHLADARRMAEEGGLLAAPGPPPPIVRSHRGTWGDLLRVAEVLERLLCDARFPLARRVVHGLEFCRLLEMCRLEQLAGGRLAGLLEILHDAALEQSGPFFRERPRPDRATAMLFRQAALEYVRLHPKFVVERSWRERWRLVRAAAAFYRGAGPMPFMHAAFPATTFEQLEEPLGPLPADVMRPLLAYFETAAASKRYAVLNRPGWSLSESYGELALRYVVGMWLLRLRCAEGPPQREAMIDVVGALDRAERYAPLAGSRHRRRIGWMTRRGGLARLAAWYAK